MSDLCKRGHEPAGGAVTSLLTCTIRRDPNQPLLPSLEDHRTRKDQIS